MGTPEFAVGSLRKLRNENFNIVGVITSPDKPSGRGRKIKSSPVKQYALQQGLKIFQPEKLKDPGFIHEITSLKPDLQVVVAFRMLPEEVWKLPRFGTINLHASLLPQYRGAAPINWAIINGETETGVTTFFINEKIDTGKIIFQEKVPIQQDETAGELHDKLMQTGANLLVQTVSAIMFDTCSQIDQSTLIENNIPLKPAPKIHSEDCRINWNLGVEDIYNLIRGLSPDPGSWSELDINQGETLFLKIYKSDKEMVKPSHPPGTIVSDNKKYVKVAAKDGYIILQNIQQAGKKRMDIEDFLRGIKIR